MTKGELTAVQKELVSELRSMANSLGVHQDTAMQCLDLAWKIATTDLGDPDPVGPPWEDTARQYARDREYYQGLVDEIGKEFGVAARTSDDGSVQQDVLCAKVPALVRALVARTPGN